MAPNDNTAQHRRLQVHLNHLMGASSSVNPEEMLLHDQTYGIQRKLERNDTSATTSSSLVLEHNFTKARQYGSNGVDVETLKAFLDGKYADVSTYESMLFIDVLFLSS